MRMMIAASVTAAALLASPALAQEKPFDGPSVTVIAGVDSDRMSSGRETGFLYGDQIGYDVQTDKLVLGVEGEVTGSSSRGCYSYVSTTPSYTYTSCSRAGRDLYVGGRLGVTAGATTLIYGKAGYTNARNGFSLTYTGTPPYNGAGRGNSDGFRVGAGIEKLVTDRMTLKAEYRYSNYDRVQNRHQVVAGVGLRF